MSQMIVTPVTLDGTHVRLEPLAQKHAEKIFSASQYPEIWEWFLMPQWKSVDETREWIRKAESQAAAGTNIWFAIIRQSDNRVVGVTSYLNISQYDRSLEIGGTWLTPEVWRTPLNTECKFLLLRHAFETLGCVRVQIKTDERNVRSQRAIERLGAVKEGVLRKYQKNYADYHRNTVMYSIIDTEWAAVKARLEEKLSSHQ